MPGKLNSNQLHYITHTCIADSSDAAPRITVPSTRRRGTATRSKPTILPASNAAAAAPRAPQKKKKGLRRFICLQSPRRGRKLVKREVRVRVVEEERWREIEGFLEGGRGHGGEGVVVTRVRWDLED